MQTIKEILQGYKDKKFTVKDVFSTYLNRIKKYEPTLGALITIRDEQDIYGTISSNNNAIPVIHKDIFSTKNIQTTAGSNILKGYIPPYDATSVARLTDNNFVTIAKANLDAFAHGATGEHSDFKPTKNPYDLSRTPGGSSSGSAVAVAAGLTPIATATDTGGSIRLPASYTNTVGIKPTYGRVSRFGIIAMTSSTDSIGHITKTVWDNAYILNLTAGFDEKDATSAQVAVPNYTTFIGKSIKGIKIGVPKQYTQNLSPEVEKSLDRIIKILEQQGAVIVTDVTLEHTQYAINVYYVITPSEVSSNLARFDGIRFGHDRSKFGKEAKRRIMIGTFCLSSGYYDAYYKKAQQVRTLIINDFKNAFKQVDALIAPVSPDLPPKLGNMQGDPIKEYMMDVLTVPANLAGVPALSVPAGFSSNKLPVGIQLISDHFNEGLLYQIASTIESETEFYKQTPNLDNL